MAKERFARSEKTIKDDAPQELLQASYVQDIDYSGAAEAETHNTGFMPGSGFWNSMSNISQDVHNTRRVLNVNAHNEEINEERFRLQAQFELDKDRMQRQVNKEALDFSARYTAGMQQVYEDALYGQTDSTPQIQAYDESVQKDIDKLYTDAPALADALNNKRAHITNEYMVKGYSLDRKKEATRNLTSTAKNTNVTLSSYLANMDGTESIQSGFDKALIGLANNYGIYQGELGAQAQTQALVDYNLAAKVAAEKIVAMQKAGMITAADARALLQDFLSNNLTRTITSEDGVTHELSLSPDTVESMLTSVLNLTDAKQKLDLYTTAKGYEELVKSKDYLQYTSLSRAKDDFIAGYDKCWDAFGLSGESEHKNHAMDMAHSFYLDTQPYMHMREIFKNRYNTTGSIAGARQQILGLRGDLLKAYQEGRPLSSVTQLSVKLPDGTSQFVYGLPGPEDTRFQMFMEMGPYNSRQEAERAYMLNMIAKCDEFLKEDDSTIMSIVNTSYNDSLLNLGTAWDYRSLVVENPSTGDIAPNLANIDAATKALKDSMIAEGAAYGSMMFPSNNVKMLDIINTNLKDKSAPQKQAYINALAMVIGKGNVSSMFINGLDGMTLNNNQLDTLYRLNTAILTQGDMRLEQMAQHYTDLFKDPQFSMKADQDISKAFKEGSLGMLTDSVDATINKILAEYHIAPEKFPMLREVIKGLTVAELKADEVAGRKATVDIADIARSVVDHNFDPKSGVYLKSKIFTENKFSLNSYRELHDKVNKQMETINKAVGADKKDAVRVTMDEETGNLIFMQNGVKVAASGDTSTFAGTGIIPINISAINTTGLPQEVFEKHLTDDVMPLAALVIYGNNPNSAPRLLERYGRKYGKEFNHDKMETRLLALGNEFSKPDFTRGLILHLAGRGDTDIVKAPQDFKDDMNRLMNLAPYGDVPKNMLSKAWQAFEEHPIETGVIVGEAILHGSAMLRGTGNPVGKLSGAATGMLYSISDKIYNMQYPQAGINDSTWDYIYSSTQNGRTMSLSSPKNLSDELAGYPLSKMESELKKRGWAVTSTNTGKHAENSLHYVNKAIDAAPYGGYKRDNMSKEIPKSALEPTAKLYEDMAKHGSLSRVCTGNEEWVRYFGHMKNAKGEPLFYLYKKADLVNEHRNHEHLEFSKPYGKNAEEVIATAKAKLSLNLYDRAKGGLTQQECNAIVGRYSNYKPDKWDEQNTGRSLAELNTNDVTRVYAASQRYRTLRDITGSPELACAIMAGATFNIEADDPKNWNNAYSRPPQVVEQRVQGLAIATKMNELKAKGYTNINLVLVSDKGKTLQATHNYYRNSYKSFMK